MCDYSLHLVASRPAKVGDKLVATDFVKSITGGFAAVGEPDVAVCLLPGTELAFEENVQYQRAFSLFGRAKSWCGCTSGGQEFESLRARQFTILLEAVRFRRRRPLHQFMVSRLGLRPTEKPQFR